MALIETIRVRDGRAPLVTGHQGRLQASCTALRIPTPASLERLLAPWLGLGDGVVRLEVDATGIRVTTRAVPPIVSLSLVLAATPHQPYPHKITARAVFDAALAEARAADVDDALLVTTDGLVAEGTTWNIFWWEEDRPATPSLSLGILPGVGRRRVMELTPVVERSCRPSELAGRSLFATNAVRGVIPIARVGQSPVPVDARTAELSRRFWAG